MKGSRYIVDDLTELCFDEDKMAFVSGPRQVGKTTMAKWMLKQRGLGNYSNWDETKFRREWTKNPSSVIKSDWSDTGTKPIVILDEIHKAKSWKRSIKGVYDTLEMPCDILVTGSAKLDVYRKGSDSLLGRYHHFRLHPFSLAELIKRAEFVSPDDLMSAILEDSIKPRKADTETLHQLLKFGPFPDPFLGQSTRKLKLWQRSRIERLIREDLRDLSRLPELSQIEMLASLLPERVGYPISKNSLREDLEVSFNTVKRWLNYLKFLYYHFEVKPYHKSLPRSIKKEGKLYLWDWSEVEEPGDRFENLIGSHLLKYCHYSHDIGYGDFELRYIRDKEKKEIDFLITKNRKPWIPIEVKLNDDQPSPNWDAFMKFLKCPHAIQVTAKSGVFKKIKRDGYEIVIISADKFLQYLV